MDFWCRFGLKEKEWARGSLLLGARPAFVCALMLSFRETKAKKHQDRLLAFTLLNRDRLRLVFAPTAVETIMDQLDNPLAVKDTIIQVVSANDLGEALFDDLAQKLLSQQVSAAIEKEVKKLAAVNMTAQLFDQKCREILIAAAEADPGELLKGRRTVTINYRGIEVL